MDEYIKRDFALDVVKRTMGDYAAAFVEIAHAKTADVVEVVRCKDCIYCKNEGSDILFCSNFLKDMMPDDYCSCGERRENVTQM